MPELTPGGAGEFLLYAGPDGRARVECRVGDGTLWLSLDQMAEVFGRHKSVISKHLKAIFAEYELSREAVVARHATTAADGKTYQVDYYRLEAVLAVGYRVRSARGVQFRQWATVRLEEYLRKGFTLDDDRLKNPPGPGVPDYYDELLERIRDIRASERRLYLRVTEIFALAADYDPKSDEVRTFFQTAQNKLHFAVTGKTAPELIAERADPAAPHMGLTAWKSAEIRRTDVTVAKNYLREPEVTELNRVVTMFLDYAEDQARRRRQVFLRDWRDKLDDFLRFNDRAVLDGTGTVSRDDADRRAQAAFEVFARHRREAAEAAGERALQELTDKIKRPPSRP